MKHVFWIHSNITYLVCKHIVELNKIESDAVVILLTRGYKLPIKHDWLTINFPYYLDNKNFKPIFKHKDSSGTKRRISDVKFIISKATDNNQFIFYIPHSLIEAISCVISLNLCISYFYIEEGLAAYIRNNFINENTFKDKIKSFVKSFYKSRVESYREFDFLRKSMFYTNFPKFEGVYALTSNSFESISPSKKCIINIFENNNQNIVFSNISDDNKMDLLIVFDALVAFKVVNIDVLLKNVENKIIPFLEKSQFKKIGIKFHPEQMNWIKEEVNPIKSIFAKYDIKYVELPQDFIVESYLIKQRKELTIIGYISSLLFYGTLTDSIVYSTYDCMEKLGDNEKKWRDILKPIFLNRKIKFI